LDPKEISELNKNDVAGFKWKSGNQRSIDWSIWNRKEMQSTTLFNTVLEKTIRYIDQSK